MNEQELMALAARQGGAGPGGLGGPPGTGPEQAMADPQAMDPMQGMDPGEMAAMLGRQVADEADAAHAMIERQKQQAVAQIMAAVEQAAMIGPVTADGPATVPSGAPQGAPQMALA